MRARTAITSLSIADGRQHQETANFAPMTRSPPVTTQPASHRVLRRLGIHQAGETRKDAKRVQRTKAMRRPTLESGRINECANMPGTCRHTPNGTEAQPA